MNAKKLQLSFALILGLTALAGMLALLGIWGSVPPMAHAQGDPTRYVAPTGNDASDCTDSDNPCLTVQYAVDQAGAGDEIHVATGTYTDINNYGGHSQVVYISKTVTLRGGYSADFSAWDPDAHSTTLDAQSGGRVVYISGDVNPTVEGLRITGGQSPFQSWGGGGIYLDGSSAILKRNVITDNSAMIGLRSGGGLYLDYSTVTLEGNVIADNLASAGGGLYLYDSVISSTNDVIVDNSGISHGSGLAVWGSSVRLWHTTIARNTDEEGVYVTGSSSSAALTNVILVSHTVGIEVTAGNIATLTATLWGSGAWANGNDWSGPGTINRNNDLWGDPDFVDPDDGYYHIGTDSAALDGGVFAGVTDDVDGEARPTDAGRPDAPDLGADENKSLTVRRTVTDTMTFGAACARLIFTDTGGLSSITMTVVPGRFPTDRPTDQVVSRTVVITPSSSAAFSATLALCYEDDEVKDGLNEDDLSLYRWRGAGQGWEGYGSTVDTANNLVTGTGVADFSSWVIGNRNASPTAIMLRNFGARSANPKGFGALLMGLLALALRLRWRRHSPRAQDE